LSHSANEVWLAEQEEAILTDIALRHPFLQTLSGVLTSKEVARPLIREMYFVVQNFPYYIAASIGTCRDEEFFLVMADNLFVETGERSGVHHIEIFRDLLRALNLREGRLQGNEVWKSTRRLDQVCARNYASWDMGKKLGSLYAFETMSGPMVSYWDDALRINGFLEQRAYRFFTIHREIEIRHSKDIEPLILKYAGDPIFRRTFEVTQKAVMFALSSWWNDMYSLIVAGSLPIGEESLFVTN
jgi:pyrroloquinoline quinone (PQQ) biosynthesis protein C